MERREAPGLLARARAPRDPHFPPKTWVPEAWRVAGFRTPGRGGFANLLGASRRSIPFLFLLRHKRQMIRLGAGGGFLIVEAAFTARTSRKRSGDGDRESLPHGRDRVWNVSFRPQWRILWVGNLWEWQAARTARWNASLRGECSP